MSAPKFAKGDRVRVVERSFLAEPIVGTEWTVVKPDADGAFIDDERGSWMANAELELVETERYPLWCYDSGDNQEEHRYAGPFETEAEAEALVGYGQVRRCRRLLASEADIGREELFDLLAREFNDPMPWRVAAIGTIWWPDENSLVKVKPGSAEKLAALLDEIIEVNVFVCEGDEP